MLSSCAKCISPNNTVVSYVNEGLRDSSQQPRLTDRENIYTMLQKQIRNKINFIRKGVDINMSHF